MRCKWAGFAVFIGAGRLATSVHVKASVFCNVSARSRHFVNVDVIFLPSVCNSFCISAFSLGQGCRSFCHELYEQSTVVFCKSGRDACFEIVCILCADHFFLVSLVPLSRFQQLCLFPLRSARKHTRKYVLLSALLHDQSCLQSSSCFQHQFVWLPFFSNPCLQGWATICSFVYM